MLTFILLPVTMVFSPVILIWLTIYVQWSDFFFTSAPSYDGVMYAINLKCLKSVCCFDVINLGMVPEELVKTKKVVSSINISKWSAGSVHVKLKFCPAQNQVSYGTDFAKDWCNGGVSLTLFLANPQPLCEIHTK